MAVSPFPGLVQLQTINACQAACVMCPYPVYSKVFERGRMDDDLFEKVISEIASHPEVKTFVPMLQNEPLLDKRLFDRIARFKQLTSGRVKVELVTNGALLTDAAVERIREVELDVLDISLDALSRETYERIRIGLDFDEVIAGVERVLAANLSRTRVLVRLVRQRENMAEIAAFAKAWRKRGVAVFIYTAHDRAGSVKGFDERVRIPERELPMLQRAERLVSRAWFGHCPIPFAMTSILHNGDMLMCVNDWRRRIVLGNVRDSTIAELWNGDQMRDIRKLISERRYDEVASCRDCSLWKDGWF
jgi:radical SAM protein with 4Fe4S-binding SPASM domain